MSFPPDPKAAQKSNNNQKRNFDFQPNFGSKISQSPENMPIKKIRRDDSWRPDAPSQQIQPPHQMHSPPIQKILSKDFERVPPPSSSSPSLDTCVQNMIKKEMNKFLYENNKIREELKNVKKQFIGNINDIQKNVDEKIVAAVIKKSSEKEAKIQSTTFEIPRSLEERIEKIEQNLTAVTEQIKKITENLSNPENTKMEERIAAVVEEKLELRKEIVIVSKDPKWYIPEKKCKELYSYSQGQVARFLADYLPILYDLPGIIAPFKSDEKGEEARAVIDHFWNGSLTTDLCIKEIEKEHANQRYKTSRKIYQALKNSLGAIMSKSGTIYECNWDNEKQKFIPKLGDYEILRPQYNEAEEFKIKKVQFEWAIPKDMYKEKFDKDDYLIVAKNDDLNQTRISKIDLETLQIQMLYTKRKYGNT